MIKPKLKKTIFFIISGPSGTGEDSVIEGLYKKLKFERVITTVTRPMRKGESEGHPYYFVSIPRFKKMIKNKEFFEWAKVYGDLRGTTLKEIERLKKKKVLALWKIDFQGVKTVKKKMPEVIAILIAPPSLEILEKRLIKRGQDSINTIKKRMPFTKEWLKHKNYYDFIVVNKENKLNETIEKVFQIIKNALNKQAK